MWEQGASMETTLPVVETTSLGIPLGLLAQNGSGIPPWGVYALIGVIGLLVVLVLPRRLARRSKALPRQARSETDELRRSMQELLIQLQEVSREVNASLDTKMIALNELIQEAETKIRHLQGLLPVAPPREAVSAEPSPPAGQAGRNETETMVVRLAEAGRTELEIAQETGIPHGEIERSEERRVGKECRSRWSPYH